jgi:hypothetical protein
MPSQKPTPRPTQKRLAGVFEGGERILVWCREIQAMSAGIAYMAAEEPAASQIDVDMVLEKLAEIERHVRDSAPVASCGCVDRKSCKVCKGYGWLSGGRLREIYSRAPQPA